MGTSRRITWRTCAAAASLYHTANSGLGRADHREVLDPRGRHTYTDDAEPLRALDIEVELLMHPPHSFIKARQRQP